jgi:hypothetical protein
MTQSRITFRFIGAALFNQKDRALRAILVRVRAYSAVRADRISRAVPADMRRIGLFGGTCFGRFCAHLFFFAASYHSSNKLLQLFGIVHNAR